MYELIFSAGILFILCGQSLLILSCFVFICVAKLVNFVSCAMLLWAHKPLRVYAKLIFYVEYDCLWIHNRSTITLLNVRLYAYSTPSLPQCCCCGCTSGYGCINFRIFIIGLVMDVLS